jgi:tripartite-type tricarboxylate transporter receptor subunit TctC
MRFAIAVAALVFAAAPALAQQYPSKPVRVIVPFPPGTATDILARLTADQLAKSLGQQFVVENRPGAGGVIGTEAAAKAPADGYTLVMATSGPFGINPAIYPKLPYDPIGDFAPITNIGLTPQTLVVNPNAPFKTLAEMIAHVRAKGAIAYASLGNGTTSHLTMEMLRTAADVKLEHVPFKGSTDAQTQIIGGQVAMMFDTVPGVLAQVRAGKLRALGVASSTRSPFLLDVPTIAEQGYPGFESVGWIGIGAPAKTPEPILERLNAEIRRLLATPEAKERMTALAFVPVGDTREQFGAFMRAEIARWTRAVKASGAKVD